MLWIAASVAALAILILGAIIWSACVVAGRVDRAQEEYWSQQEPDQ